ncbi:WYL domain-containing protein [Clostridium sp. DL1XJH146]
MAKFSELIKNFDKIRDYMRDFYVYGFKSRGDFNQKSCRTYDNEKRRIECYLKDYIKWDNSIRGKHVFISLNSSEISENPLYSAWKSKSFTSNDIMLYFYILDILKLKRTLNIEDLTNYICNESGEIFEVQTVRNKANEYVKEGVLKKIKKGRALYYSLSKEYLNNVTNNHEGLLDALKFYQEVAPFGVIGSYILDEEEENNNIFCFKHHFIVHTLEDKILLDIIKAMKEKRRIEFFNQSNRSNASSSLVGVPLKILVSSQSGRRYISIYNEEKHRFTNYRLDYIKSVKKMNLCTNYDELKEKLGTNLWKCWGVSFGSKNRNDSISIKFYIDENNEGYVLNRLYREGRGGTVEKIEDNIFLYTKEAFDVNEMMSWVKSFTGRIISLESSNSFVEKKFYEDMRRMEEMYLGGGEI